MHYHGDKRFSYSMNANAHCDKRKFDENYDRIFGKKKNKKGGDKDVSQKSKEEQASSFA
jgi:hypothetical protein